MRKWLMALLLIAGVSILSACSSERQQAPPPFETAEWKISRQIRLNDSALPVRQGNYQRTSKLFAGTSGPIYALWTENKNQHLMFQSIDPMNGEPVAPRDLFPGANAWIDYSDLIVDDTGRKLYLTAWFKERLTSGPGRKDAKGGGKRIVFLSSEDGGANWSQQIDLNFAFGAFGPEIASDRQNSLYVVWKDERHGFSDLYFNRSRDNGKTWLAKDLRLGLGEIGRRSTPITSCSVCRAGRFSWLFRILMWTAGLPGFLPQLPGFR